MHTLDYLLLALVGIWLVFALVKSYKNRKNGCSGCSGNCSQCTKHGK